MATARAMRALLKRRIMEIIPSSKQTVKKAVSADGLRLENQASRQGAQGVRQQRPQLWE